MPSLEDLLEYEGGSPLGEIDGTEYYRLAIVVEVNHKGTRPLCMADDWEKSWPARLIAAQERIGDLTTDLHYAQQNHTKSIEELQSALERASKVTWLESEVARLTHDLERYRQQEAAQRGTYDTAPYMQSRSSAADDIIKSDAWQNPNKPRIYQPADLENQRRCDALDRCAVTGVIKDAPCDCEHCLSMRQAYQTMDRLNRPVNSHIAPEAPIFRKLCQCEDCRELRAHSGLNAAEIEGH